VCSPEAFSHGQWEDVFGAAVPAFPRYIRASSLSLVYPGREDVMRGAASWSIYLNLVRSRLRRRDLLRKCGGEMPLPHVRGFVSQIRSRWIAAALPILERG